MEEKVSGKGVAWFDRLLEGGVRFPAHAQGDEATRPLIFLINGPPGTGKTTLATEICYRWALQGRQSLYITTEAPEDWFIENAMDLGWQSVAHVMAKRDAAVASPARDDALSSRRPSLGRVSVASALDPKQLMDWLSSRSGSKASAAVAAFLATASKAWPRYPGVSSAQSPQALLKPSRASSGDIALSAQVIVVDSLNALPDGESNFFATLPDLHKELPNLRVLLVIVDSDPNKSPSDFWEYLSDIVVRLDRSYEPGYMIRTIEIVKARYQQHAWGKHQLKIYGPLEQVEHELDRMRTHPYREEGGIFIFPSIHYVLSKYKRKAPEAPSQDGASEPIEHLSKVVTFPLGQCTALVGARGTHKSHLGYVVLLSRILEEKSSHRALVVSLRDGEGLTRDHMDKILKEQFPKHVGGIKGFEAQGKLEIMYYPPGYITPEEFFHRLLLSINRLAAGNAHVTLLFNSLDQLSSRFPLCAKESIFVPGIVQMLSASRVSSIFVAARDESRESQTAEYYTLMSVAEALVSLAPDSIDRTEYIDLVKHYYKTKSQTEKSVLSKLREKHEAVALSVERFAGGQPAGARGFLELIPERISADDPLLKLYGRRGLVFLPVQTKRRQDQL